MKSHLNKKSDTKMPEQIALVILLSECIKTMRIYMFNTTLFNFLGIHFFITSNLFRIILCILQFGQHKYDFHYLLTFKSCKNVMIALTRRFAKNKYEFYNTNEMPFAWVKEFLNQIK